MKKLIFILSIFTLVSCTKELDKLPLNAPSSESFPSTEKELQTAIAGCQTPLTICSGENPFINVYEMYSDVATNRDTRPENMWGDPSSGHVSVIWTNMYRSIARCNYILDNLDRVANVDATIISEAEAQAKFIRAYCYSVLSGFYGGVPLVTKTQKLSEAYLPRNSKEEVVAFILSELEDASNSLTVTNRPNTMAITKGAAWALEARVALYNENWLQAINASQKVMALEGTEYTLNPDFGNICLRAGKTSKEIIWAIQYNYNDIVQSNPLSMRSRMAAGFNNRMPVQSLVDSYLCTDGLTINKSPLYDPAKPFINRDPRLGLTIALPSSIYYGYQFETHKDSLFCWNYNVSPAKRVPNLDATHTYASFSGYAWRKYADPTETDPVKSDINIIVMRYAEVLLTYAEAKIEANQLDASVYSAINKLRSRVKMPAITPGKTQAELRSIVRIERKCELAGEGLRYMDILRWKIAEQVLNGPCYGRIPRGYLSSAPSIDDNGTPDYSNVSNYLGMRVIQTRVFNKTKNYLWPIPTIEILTNKNLVQNPNY